MREHEVNVGIGPAKSSSKQVKDDLGRITGHVAYFNNVKGYGYIIRDDNGEKIFFNRSALKGNGFQFLNVESPIVEIKEELIDNATVTIGTEGEYIDAVKYLDGINNELKNNLALEVNLEAQSAEQFDSLNKDILLQMLPRGNRA